MELLLLLALGVGGLWLGRAMLRSARAAAYARQYHQQRHLGWRARKAGVAKRRAEELRRLNRLARNLQLALIGVRKAPDFRRAASWAAVAGDVPLAFRQRQYRRFRPLLVEHFRARLSAGDAAEPLVQSLSALVQALGVAPFEADYIRREAERTLATRRLPAADVPYGQQIAQAQAEHEQRLAALQGAQVSDEIREQLLEAEETRFRETLQSLTSADSPAVPPIADGRLP
jgi:hypothetical protein